MKKNISRRWLCASVLCGALFTSGVADARPGASAFGSFAFAGSEKKDAMDFYGVRRIYPRTEFELEMLFGISFGGAFMDPASYTVVSFDDPAYFQSALVRPARVFDYAKHLEFKSANGVRREYFTHTLKLKLPHPMKKGCSYGVSTLGLTYGRTFAFFKYSADSRGAAVTEPAAARRFYGLRGAENLGRSYLRLMFGPDFNFANAAGHNYSVELNGSEVAAEFIHARMVTDGFLAQGDPLERILRYDVFLKLRGGAVVRDGCRVRVSVPPLIRFSE